MKFFVLILMTFFLVENVHAQDKYERTRRLKLLQFAQQDLEDLKRSSMLPISVESQKEIEDNLVDVIVPVSKTFSDATPELREALITIKDRDDGFQMEKTRVTQALETARNYSNTDVSLDFVHNHIHVLASLNEQIRKHVDDPQVPKNLSALSDLTWREYAHKIISSEFKGYNDLIRQRSSASQGIRGVPGQVGFLIGSTLEMQGKAQGLKVIEDIQTKATSITK